jgi:transposase
VDPESVARLIDAFVNSLDMTQFGIKEAAQEGRPSYDPKGLLKLYIYGYKKRIRSSRQLAESCHINMEVKWMVGGVEPDFRTISDFRKNNAKCLKDVFYEFNKRLTGAVEWGFVSVDGSKIQANNSKDNNYTKNKLDDRVRRANAHAEEYIRELDEMDEHENSEEDNGGDIEKDGWTREEIQELLEAARKKTEKLESYQKTMEETGASQLSLTDADARLMKNKNGFAVAYNPQTAVDSETHIIRDYKMTNQVTDHGQMYPTIEKIKSDNQDKILEVVADKGYENAEDMVKCLEEGIVPHVILDDGKDSYEIEIPYEEAECDESSVNPEELKKCLHAGKVPEAYKDVIENMTVVEVRRRVKDTSEQTPVKSIYGTEEEMIARAKEGYFVRDPERNCVYCPDGEILRQKCIKKNGNIRYSNKNACRHCKNRNKCYKGKNEWKEIDFTKDKLEKPCRDWLEAEGSEIQENRSDRKKYEYETVKVARFDLKPNRKKMSKRMCLSEHPFGTIKRAMGFTYFLLRGMEKVDGEFALSCLAYNIERAKNLLGFDKMMELMVGV